jgi:hypothetical protein
MTEITLKTLQETREQLNASYEQLKQLKGECITGDSDVITRLELQMAQITELKEKFIEQHEALSTVLPDGTKLWPGQFESLERFASNNGLDIESVRSRITVEGGIVTGCDFSKMALTTLSGLEGLVRLRKLKVNYNPRLTSLKGIPTQAIESISAECCGFTGDLSELSGADKLKDLDVSSNKGVTSLKGIPTQAIERICASWCGLTGDLSELSGAVNLGLIFLHGNEGLTSLRGLSTRSINRIYAERCGLTGDLSELSRADQLEILNIDHNKGVTSLKEIPREKIRWIIARGCSLTGDHTFLSRAQDLQLLNVRFNPDLTLDKTQFNPRVVIEK